MFNATNQVTTEATYRVTPIHEVPETAKRMEVLNSWSGQAFSVNWSNISEDNSYGKKIEEWVIILGNTEQLVVNDTPVVLIWIKMELWCTVLIGPIQMVD